MDSTDKWWSPLPDSAPPAKPKSFLLKLKIKPRTHVCYFCSKEFSNGKALGGHIRIHMNHAKSRRRQKKRNPEISDSASGLEEIGGDQEIVRCFLCDKEFGSMKSLFGHMRNHPGRGWKGIKPPPLLPPSNLEKNSCCSSVSENELAAEVDDQMSCAAAAAPAPGTDLFKSFSKWSYVTAEESPRKVVSDEISEAAYALMMLSQSKDEVKLMRTNNRILDFDLNEPFVPSLNQVE